MSLKEKKTGYIVLSVKIKIMYKKETHSDKCINYINFKILSSITKGNWANSATHHHYFCFFTAN